MITELTSSQRSSDDVTFSSISSFENSSITLLGNNSSSSWDRNEETGEDEHALWTNVIGVWLTGVICILGLAGNVASFIVLWRAFGHSPMFYVLRATSLADCVFLLTVFVLNTVLNACHDTGPVAVWCDAAAGYIQWAIWPVLMTSQMLTVWLAVLVSGERFIAICYPLKSASFCTLARARRYVIILTAISIVYCIPRYFEYKVNEIGHMVKGEVGEHPVYRYLYSATLYSIFLFFLPLTLIAFLNVRLLLALKRGKRQWGDLKQRQRKEQSVTLIPLTIVATFFVCGTPALAVNVIEALDPAAALTPSFVTFIVVANLLVVVNSGSNFVIYYLLGRKFRQKLLELCCCQPPPTPQSYRLVMSNVGDVIGRGHDDSASQRRLTLGLCLAARNGVSPYNNNSTITKLSCDISVTSTLSPISP